MQHTGLSTQVAENNLNARPHLAEDGTNDNTGQIRFLTEGGVKTEWVPVTCKRREIIREGESLVSPQSGAFILSLERGKAQEGE